MGTFVVAVLLAAIAGAALYVTVKSRGKSGGCSGCGGCPGSDACHSARDTVE